MERMTETKVLSPYTELQDKIAKKTAKIGIFGLGYVGLPHAMHYGEQGFFVRGIDTATEKIRSLKKGVSYVDDISNEEVWKFMINNTVTDTYYDLDELDVLLVDVPTPLDEAGHPDMKCLESAATAILEQVRPGQLIILESTSYPTTTQEFFVEPLREKGFVLGEDIFVAFSPERIDPGNQDYDIRNTPKLVGGVTAICTELAAKLIGENAVAMTSPEAAEMAKLYENTFRFINIGLANELARICDRIDVEVDEVLDAAATKPFGFMKFHPAIKVGGHCIGVDPYYLKWFMEKNDSTTPVLNAASEMNQSMLPYAVSKIIKTLSEKQISTFETKLAVYGVTYKKNISDLRLSAAPDLTKQLEEYGIEVTLVDPMVNSIRIDQEDRPVLHPDQVVPSDFDLVLLLVDHDDFDYPQIAAEAKLLFDTKGVTKELAANYRFGL